MLVYYLTYCGLNVHIQFQSKQEHNRGLSFDSISSSGPNGAVIHYRPSTLTNRPITTSEMYLLDSGGQYL